MTYEQFKMRLIRTLLTEYNINGEDIIFLPKGATSNDEKLLELIRLSNKAYAKSSDDKDVLREDSFFVWRDAGGKARFVHCIPAESLYMTSRESGFEGAFNEIHETMKNCMEAKLDDENLRVRRTNNYNDIRDTLIVRPLNYRIHFHDLSDCIYRRFGEVTLVLYQLVGETKDVVTTSRIKRDEIIEWNMEGKEMEILQDALENTAKLWPACVSDRRTGKETEFLTSDITKDDMQLPTGQTLISTKRVTNGAAALFYPGVIKKLMKVMGSEFVAVFMNVDDVMIFEPDDPLAKQYAHTAGKPQPDVEILSGKRYRCDEDGIHAIL